MGQGSRVGKDLWYVGSLSLRELGFSIFLCQAISYLSLLSESLSYLSILMKLRSNSSRNEAWSFRLDLRQLCVSCTSIILSLPYMSRLIFAPVKTGGGWIRWFHTMTGLEDRGDTCTDFCRDLLPSNMSQFKFKWSMKCYWSLLRTSKMCSITSSSKYRIYWCRNDSTCLHDESKHGWRYYYADSIRVQK